MLRRYYNVVSSLPYILRGALVRVNPLRRPTGYTPATSQSNSQDTIISHRAFSYLVLILLYILLRYLLVLEAYIATGLRPLVNNKVLVIRYRRLDRFLWSLGALVCIPGSPRAPLL